MDRVNIPAFVLLFIFGLLTGSTLTAWSTRSVPPLALVDDPSTVDVPVVRLEGIRNGMLVGSVSGEVRVVADGVPVETGGGGSFAVSDRDVLTNIINVDIPPGMHFVASKKGKKYYPITSAQARQIVPGNRVYFRTAGEAEAAGYRR